MNIKNIKQALFDWFAFGALDENMANAKVLLEIEAGEKLIKNTKQWKIPETEMKETIKRLESYKADLEKLNKK